MGTKGSKAYAINKVNGGKYKMQRFSKIHEYFFKIHLFTPIVKFILSFVPKKKCFKFDINAGGYRISNLSVYKNVIIVKI